MQAKLINKAFYTNKYLFEGTDERKMKQSTNFIKLILSFDHEFRTHLWKSDYTV